MTTLYALQALPFNKAWDTVIEMVNTFFAYLPFILIGILVFFLFLLLARMTRKIIVQVGKRTRLDITLAKILSSLASLAIILLGVLVAAVIIFPTFSPGDLVTGLGITSVAIGFAFKDILQNLFAGILLLWRQPFQIGDQIRTQNFEGTVEEINVRSTYLKTYSGERVVIPNGDIYTQPVLVNTAFNKRRVQFTVGIGYPDSIEGARESIYRTLQETEGVLDEPEAWVYVAELAPSSVNFNVYFWVEPHQANVLKVSDKVATGIKLSLDKVGIDIPYPHTVVLFHDTTGSRKGVLYPMPPQYPGESIRNEVEIMNNQTDKPILKPGEIVPDSGIYQDTKSGNRATLVKGEHAPPTQQQDSYWEQVIDTNPNN